MITVACVLRSGGDFDAEDVRRLAQGVQRHMTVPYRFVCLTDALTDVTWQRSSWVRREQNSLALDTEPLRSDWPGWWAKMELFNLSDDVVLCFDLDTVIVGSLQPLIEDVRRSRGLCMLRSFLNPNLLQSGVLAWRDECRWPLWIFPPAQDNGTPWSFVRRRGHHELRSGSRVYRGDGEWLHGAVHKCHRPVRPLQDMTPGIYSYKVNVQPTGKLPDDARIICFHGRPRPKELGAGASWLKEHWR